jgi:tryptophan-rich sensory protein
MVHRSLVATRVRSAVTSIVLVSATTLLGSVVTAEAVQTWYPTVVKPAFTPPSWVFGPVWTLLYGLMAVSLYLVLRAGADDPVRIRRPVGLFLLQLGLNAGWSLAFFGLRSPAAGLAVIAALFGAIVATIKAFRPVSKRAAYLLVPYLLWVTFAFILNAAIWWLN